MERSYDSNEIAIDSNSLSYLQDLTERSMQNGVQIGVPWEKGVYEYLFEDGSVSDLQAILEAISGGDFIEVDAE